LQAKARYDRRASSMDTAASVMPCTGRRSCRIADLKRSGARRRSLPGGCLRCRRTAAWR
jgi:hypothetical protein